jgi:hypothetical protein
MIHQSFGSGIDKVYEHLHESDSTRVRGKEGLTIIAVWENANGAWFGELQILQSQSRYQKLRMDVSRVFFFES